MSRNHFPLCAAAGRRAHHQLAPGSMREAPGVSSHRRVAAFNRDSFLSISILPIRPIAHLSRFVRLCFFPPPTYSCRVYPACSRTKRKCFPFATSAVGLAESCCAEMVARQQLSGSPMSVFTTRLVSQRGSKKSCCPDVICSK